MSATATAAIVDGEVSLDPSDISAVDERRQTNRVNGQVYAAMRVICGKSRRWSAGNGWEIVDAVQIAMGQQGGLDST